MGRSVMAVACVALLAGCSKNSSETRPAPGDGTDVPSVSTQPADDDASTGMRPAEEPATTQPIPATRPADTLPPLPESTYDSEPPYPVQLYVRDPEQDQPGWLKILEISDGADMGTTTGTFPEQNKILVDTSNVKKLRLHIGHLPLDPKKGAFLRIDRQPIQLAQKDREYIVLERSPGGTWELIESIK